MPDTIPRPASPASPVWPDQRHVQQQRRDRLGPDDVVRSDRLTRTRRHSRARSGRSGRAFFFTVPARTRAASSHIPMIRLTLSDSQGRGPRRRRHGRADRGAPRECQRSRRPVRSRREGRRPQRHRQQGARRAREARALASGNRGSLGLHRRGELRPRPRSARRLRPRHRGDRRADGLEARPLCEGRTASRAARDRRVEHLRALDQRAGGSAARGGAAPLLRHPLLQPAALHAPGRADRAEAHRSRAPGRARDLRRHDARQGRRAREGHAELRRQPGRHLLGAGDDGAHGDVQAVVRRGRCA